MSKKKVARFKDMDKAIQSVLGEGLYDMEKYDKFDDENRKTLVLDQHADIFKDPADYEKVKQALVEGTGRYKDWGDNARFRAYSALIGTREAYAAGLKLTVAESYDPFTGEPEEEDEEEEDSTDKYNYFDDDEDDVSYDFERENNSDDGPSTRTEYQAVY
ncbi:hypothetical protein [Chroococcidiopsis sp. CCMEE 29]|uniref:hypothetical protein n=1 Tax=Chroococcidiopsis sp. CCMEE 29 TaxID=155894 RepID=UPI0020217EC6|nr:hypothetical protein [Chroococcidiopsis sp. CCMEE 29]